MSVGEMRDLLSWIGNPPRSPLQTHGLNESDSEVLDLGNGTFLATTVDTVSEEIALGIYRDPYKIGWVAAMASLSDLAAVGARPLGMLLSAEWGASQVLADKAEIARGFSDALRRCDTYWLGGDTGRGRSTVLGGVALGICDSQPISRLGMKPGHLLCVTGQLGWGPALAIRFLRGEPLDEFSEDLYRPVARLEAGQALRGIASAAMDTSDGLLQTLHALAGLNHSGIELAWDPALIAEPARRYCEVRKIPQWILWEVEHGDYQLVISVAPEKLEEARRLVPDLFLIGRVEAVPGIRLRLPGGTLESIQPELAHSMLHACQQDVSQALEQLIAQARLRKLP